jgi:hypothetical protein
MHQLKILVTALALLVVTPVVAQEMGGAEGPGSADGLEPTYNNGYYNNGYYNNGYYNNGYYNNGYATGTNATAPLRALDGNNSKAFAQESDDGHCVPRYRSYDPSVEDTGHDGRRHSC